MKVTAILPDEIVREALLLAKTKTITASLIKALTEWIAIQKVNRLRKKLVSRPMEFRDAFSAKQIRQLNRKK
ncbi:MAG: hypothetical protein ACD_62C00560G0003 [uncultured bacterium]|nr:MAG: hypothetical protein ACD_62C00560G0003 [uncultured bacterium]HLD45674.1 DUF2191 domain-containing protein [bacterium]